MIPSFSAHSVKVFLNEPALSHLIMSGVPNVFIMFSRMCMTAFVLKLSVWLANIYPVALSAIIRYFSHCGDHSPCLAVDVGVYQLVLTRGSGHIWFFAFGVFGRCHMCLPFVVFRPSLLASTKMVWLGCMLCQRLCGIGVGDLGVVSFLSLV